MYAYIHIYVYTCIDTLRRQHAARMRRVAHIRTGTDWARTHSPPESDSAPGLRSPPAHICAGTGLTPAHICAGTGLTPAHVCAGTGLTPAHVCAGHSGTATGWAHPCFAARHGALVRPSAAVALRPRTVQAGPRHGRHVYTSIYICTHTHTYTHTHTHTQATRHLHQHDRVVRERQLDRQPLRRVQRHFRRHFRRRLRRRFESVSSARGADGRAGRRFMLRVGGCLGGRRRRRPEARRPQDPIEDRALVPWRATHTHTHTRAHTHT